jgi:hypothetical protein
MNQQLKTLNYFKKYKDISTSFLFDIRGFIFGDVYFNSVDEIKFNNNYNITTYHYISETDAKYINNNLDKITYIRYNITNAIVEMYFKNCKVHNSNGEAAIFKNTNMNLVMNINKYYFLNGRQIAKNIFNRKTKLKELI